MVVSSPVGLPMDRNVPRRRLANEWGSFGSAIRGQKIWSCGKQYDACGLALVTLAELRDYGKLGAQRRALWVQVITLDADPTRFF